MLGCLKEIVFIRDHTLEIFIKLNALVEFREVLSNIWRLTIFE